MSPDFLSFKVLKMIKIKNHPFNFGNQASIPCKDEIIVMNKNSRTNVFKMNSH